VAEGGRYQMGLETLEKCYNVRCGLLRMSRVEVVVDYSSTTETLSSW